MAKKNTVKKQSTTTVKKQNVSKKPKTSKDKKIPPVTYVWD